MTIKNKPELLAELTTQVVAAYVRNNSLRPAEIPTVMQSVYTALGKGATGAVAKAEAVEPQKPAVSVKKSLTDEHLICLDCGLKFTSLKRHIKASHNLTDDEYRAKWSLPSDYPMVAPVYSGKRSQLAKDIGLGTLRAKDKSVKDKPAKKARGKQAS